MTEGRRQGHRQMSKRTFVVFGLLVVVLAVLIPWLAFRSQRRRAPAS